MKVHLGQQKDVTILILPIPIPFGISGIDSLQENIKFENFEKVRVDSNFSIPKAVVQTLCNTTVFEKKPFLGEKKSKTSNMERLISCS